jgi:hypothetical protein
MTDYSNAQFAVLQSGAPIINSAWIVYKTDQVILIEIDMKSKYCFINASSGNSVFIGADGNSLNLDEDVDIDSDTWVEFPEAKEYSFFSGSCGRYSIQLTFIKR